MNETMDYVTNEKINVTNEKNMNGIREFLAEKPPKLLAVNERNG